MHEVTASVGKNRIIVRLAGAVTADDCRKMLAELRTQLDRLRPGFDLINDVRDLTALPDFPPELVQAAAELLKERGMGRVVRVVGKQAAVTVGLEKTSRVFGFSAALAYSMEEAEKGLDGYRG